MLTMCLTGAQSGLQAAAPPQVTEELLRTLKVSWDKQGSNSYGVEQLRELFSKHGTVEDVMLRNAKKKTKGSALVIMQTLDGARAASEAVNGAATNPLLVVPVAKAAGPAFAGTCSNHGAEAQAYDIEQPARAQRNETNDADTMQPQQNGYQDQEQQEQGLHPSAQQAPQEHPLNQSDTSVPSATPPSSPAKQAPTRNPFGGTFNPDQEQKPLFGGFNSFPSFPSFSTSAPARPLFAAGSANGTFGQSNAGPAFGAGSYSSFPGMSAVGGQAQASMQDAFGHVHAGATR